MSSFRSALSALKTPPVPASKQQPASDSMGAPKEDVSLPSEPSSPIWTPEQNAAILSPAHHLRLTALAGCGKTAVLVAYAKARPRIRWQYLAFNKAMANEAAGVFPGNTLATTFHGWAWAKYGVDLSDKMDKPVDLDRIASHLKLPCSAPWLSGYLSLLLSAVELFTRSADLTPSRNHIPAEAWGLWRQSDGAKEALDIDEAVKHLEQLWFHAQDPRSTLISASPDTAVKRAQLGRMPPRAEGLLVDESQDLSPAMLAWICQSQGPRVRAGDPYQTLYAWRSGGAGEWELPDEQGLALTSSHRFGPQIEEWVNPVLAALGCPFPLLGAGPSTLIHREAISQPHWVLGRTRAALLEEASRLQAQGVKVAWRGDRAWERLAQLKILKDGDLSLLTEPMLKGFYTLDDFIEAASDAGFDEWVELGLQVARGGVGLNPDSFVHESQAEAILSTVHQSKGKSLQRVRLLSDVFADATSAEELRVRYVALTRSRVELSLPENAKTNDVVAAPQEKTTLQGDGF